VNRVTRFRERDGRGVGPETLLDGIPAGNYHNGCRVKIGPDRKLYVTTGDAYLREPSQDKTSLAGKVLRLELDGSIPSDNPIAGSPVFTMGHRNPQGITWDPRTRVGYVIEHGTAVGGEVNVLERGANYGWPDVEGVAKNPKYKDPVFVFHAAPADALVLADSTMLVATLTGRLIKLHVNGATVSVVDDSLLVGYGRLRDIAPGPNGSVYISTSNRDRRGKPHRGDDRVLRVFVPSGGA
jgi:glucose/arabinose dehydrogenase